MANILVTGGAGFIGSNLCRRLICEGHNVICMDNLSTGRYENIAELTAYPSFRFVLHDVREPYDYDVDQIYNLACPASPIQYQKDSIGTLMTNVQGILHALDLAAKTGATVLQSSTSEVYGDAQMHPQTEDYWGNVNPIGPRACYDEGKRAAETLMFDHHRQHNTKIRVARIFNTYGPNMTNDDGRVISNFILQALNGQDITVYGDGTQTRSFCYVDDLVDGLIRLMNCKGDVCGPVNLGNPEEITVMDVAELIIAKTDSASKVIHCPLPENDPCKRKPDISLAKRLLGWSPSIRLSNGLNRTILYFMGQCTPAPSDPPKLP